MRTLYSQQSETNLTSQRSTQNSIDCNAYNACRQERLAGSSERADWQEECQAEMQQTGKRQELWQRSDTSC